MQIYEINSFKKFEEYIKERNYQIDCFDDSVLQYLAKNLKESQLFIILKNDKILNLDDIKKQLFAKGIINSEFDFYSLCQNTDFKSLIKVLYNDIIKELNDLHQPCFVGRFNERGKLLFKKWQLLYSNYDFFSKPFYIKKDFNGIIYGLKELEIFESFKELKKVFEDENIIILEIPLELLRINYNSGLQEMEYFETGYYIKPECQSEIIPYDNFYWYHYKLLTFEELKRKKGLEFIKKRDQEQKENLMLLEKKLK